MVFFSEILPNSFNDYFSWKVYDWLPKSTGGVDILFFGSNPIRKKIYTAWHKKPESVFPHTLRYRLMRAILEQDINEIKLCLDKGIDINNEIIDDKYLHTPLTLAATLNRTGIIEYLILRGADVNKRSGKGETALMYAVVNWQYDAIKLLSENGADISLTDKYGFSAIDKAKYRGLSSIQNYLDEKIKTKTNIDFPKFTIEFEFEKKFADPFENIYKKKKFYTDKAFRYPFNDFEGTYVVNFLNYHY